MTDPQSGGLAILYALALPIIALFVAVIIEAITRHRK